MTPMKKKVVILGAGLGGLTAAALIARAGHKVTVIEGNSWVGGKSKRIEVAGQRIDTGPALVTFPAVWTELLKRFDELDTESKTKASSLAELELIPLPEVGRYFFRGEQTDLPVRAGHPWKKAWDRFESEHGKLSPQITSLLTSNPVARKTLPAVLDLLLHAADPRHRTVQFCLRRHRADALHGGDHQRDVSRFVEIHRARAD